MLKTNLRSTVHQRLRDEHGLAVSVTSFRRSLWSEFPDAADESRVTVLRPDVAAGEEVLCGFPHSTSTPASWGMSMVARPLSPAHDGHTGRSLRRRSTRVNDW